MPQEEHDTTTAAAATTHDHSQLETLEHRQEEISAAITELTEEIATREERAQLLNDDFEQLEQVLASLAEFKGGLGEQLSTLEQGEASWTEAFQQAAEQMEAFGTTLTQHEETWQQAHTSLGEGLTQFTQLISEQVNQQLTEQSPKVDESSQTLQETSTQEKQKLEEAGGAEQQGHETLLATVVESLAVAEAQHNERQTVVVQLSEVFTALGGMVTQTQEAIGQQLSQAAEHVEGTGLTSLSDEMQGLDAFVNEELTGRMDDTLQLLQTEVTKLISTFGQTVTDVGENIRHRTADALDGAASHGEDHSSNLSSKVDSVHRNGLDPASDEVSRHHDEASAMADSTAGTKDYMREQQEKSEREAREKEEQEARANEERESPEDENDGW